MKFLSFYSEPACTLFRAALMVGRHPVRMGITGVLFPGTEGMGLAEEAVTESGSSEPFSNECEEQS